MFLRVLKLEGIKILLKGTKILLKGTKILLRVIICRKVFDAFFASAIHGQNCQKISIH